MGVQSLYIMCQKNLPLLVLSKAAVKIQVLVPYTENGAREHRVK